ncbi:MAG: asparagine synthase (glutamine-hydrolyzing) [Nanoarchaeota archaeon]
MCGILGFNWEDKRLARKMADSIEHRGPDDRAHYSDKGITLAMNRLAIIDLKKGLYPITNEDQDLFVVFNGEIYNFKEVRAELERKGHRFITNTDAEVITHGYEEWGMDCVTRFNGMFAIALWDTKKKLLFLARDRMGVKPLYYHWNHGKFIFASEIKAILEHSIPRKVNLQGLSWFLSFRCNPSLETMFEGIYKLAPGYTLVLQNKKLTIKPYWKQVIQPDTDGKSASFYAQQLHDLLLKSVERRMMSDVPLGVYLSSGIDSSGVVGLMHELDVPNIKTFTVGFGSKHYSDELNMAKFTAEHFGTDHQEVWVSPDTTKVLPKVVYHLDEPMADPTSIPTYLLSKEAKKKVTVVLTGEGADEQFAGYPQYHFMMLKQRYLRSHLLRKMLKKAVDLSPAWAMNTVFKYAGNLGKEGIRRGTNFLHAPSDLDAYTQVVSHFTEEEKKEVFTSNVNQRLKNFSTNQVLSKEQFTGKKDLLAEMLYFDNKTLLTENLLMKVDKNTMAASIEAREPYLDLNVVEFAGQIPSKYKLHGSTEKWIQRKAFAHTLPREVLKRKKTHFFVPLDTWMDEGLREFAQSHLNAKDLKQQGYFNPDYVDKVFDKINESKLFYTRQLWCLLSFQLWHEQYLEK